METNVKEMKFFEFTQNNTGGSFITDDKLSVRIYIESENYEQAIYKASDLGVYFYGVALGVDCPCCGDRWYSPSEIYFPHHYGFFYEKEAKEISAKYKVDAFKKPNGMYDLVFTNAEQYAQFISDKYSYSKQKPNARIFYASGIVKEINKN